MSFVTQLEQALLVAASVARPDLTTRLGPIEHQAIPPGSFPHAYTNAWARSQNSSETGTVTTYTGLMVIVGEGEDDAALEAVRELAEAVDAGIAADLTLGGLAVGTLVGIDSFPDPGGAFSVAVLAFEVDPAVVGGGGGGSATGAISWQLETSLFLQDTTIAAWEADRAAAIVTALGAGAARFDSDLADPPVEAVPAGTARFSLSVIAAPQVIGSNLTKTLLAVKLRVFHTLAAAASERSYTMATMLAQMMALAEPDFWKGAFVDAQTPDDGEPEISDLTR